MSFHETTLQFFDGGSQVGLKRVVQNLLFADGRQDGRLGVLEELVEFGFKRAAIFDGEIVEQTLGSGENDGHLFFDRQAADTAAASEFRRGAYRD